MLSTSNVAIQFGAKPLFENVSVKFGDGNRYGLIGANGCGKSTFMKILGGELEPSAGDVMLQTGHAAGQAEPEPVRLRGRARARRGADGPRGNVARDARARRHLRQRATPREEDYMQAAELEANSPSTAATPPRRAPAQHADGAGIPDEQHNGPMSAVAPG